ncbi:hypothetical protein C7N43_38715 [Sphingobacteriales bacterium UPWRP_1]|nr:hypothetical protein C7N43_38715 [Sphingobacteriales bacterium UPWRP_1]
MCFYCVYYPMLFYYSKTYNTMPYSNVSVTLTPAEITALNDAITAIKTVLNGKTVNLTPEERARLYKMRNNRLSLAEISLEQARNNANLVPPFINLAEAERDMAYYKQLRNYAGMIQSILESIDDTQKAVGSEVLKFCLPFYQSVKQAAQLDVPGTTSVYEALNEFFDLPPRPEEDTE